MRKLAFLFVAFALVAVSHGCTQDSPVAPSESAAVSSDISINSTPFLAQANLSSGEGGAHVRNSGEGKPDIYCHFGSLVADRATAVITPSGNASLSCHFDDLAPIAETYRHDGWWCYLSMAGHYLTTYKSNWTRTRSGQAKVTCQFK